MSEGFTVRGFLVAADNKTRRVRLKFNEADWVDLLDEQFPLGGEVYISAKNTGADLTAAEERGRREVEARYTPSAVAYIKELEAKIATERAEGFSAGLRRAVDRMSGYMSRADSMLYDDDIEALLAEKEAGDGREGKKEVRE